jgi:hypothetical protein
MALVISDLQGLILTQLQSLFPAPSLQPKELTAFNSLQSNLAQALANAIIPEVLKAEVNPGILVVVAGSPSTQSGATTGPGTLS